MALTAARSELNVAIVGESDVADALAKTKAEMAALEVKVRSLTGATKAQNAAVESSTSPLSSANGAMTGLAKKAEGLVEGVDKIKGAFNKVVESAGFIGMAVSGAISAFEFLRDIFDDSAEEAAKLQKQMAATQARTDAFKASVDRLTSSMRSMQAATGQGAVALRQESAQLLELQGKIDDARFEREGATIEQAKLRESELRAEGQKTLKEFEFARSKMTEAERKLRDAKDKFAFEDMMLGKKESQALYKGQKEKLDAIREERAQKKALHVADIAAQSTMLGISTASTKASEQAFEQLQERAGIAKQITAQMLENLSKFGQIMPIDQIVKGGGGGAAAKQAVIDLLAAREEERQQFLAWLKDTQAETAAVNKARADGIKADAERRAAVKDEAALFDELGVMRAKVSRELADLPTTGVTAEAFKDLREKLTKQLADIDRLMGARVEASRDGAMTTAEEDKITASLGKQRDEMEKLVGTMGLLSEARAKSNEEARQMAEAARRSLPVERMNELKDGIDQLQQMSIPAFSDIATVVGQVSEQFQKYKDKQTDMTGAAINSASAIAGSIAKQIGGVKAEAGVRALFELAMGFATLANPVESAGHFSAATLFGLVAGGVIKSGAASGAGGQKAPATRTAQTQQVGGGNGGGGSITNVYNLQTGIVDGQSTAQAFRRAEQQARNTGMATAGGW